MANASNEMTQHAEQESGTYKPTEHGGMKEDGTPDKRVSSEHGEPCSPDFARFVIPVLSFRTHVSHLLLSPVRSLGFGGDKELAHEAGVKGGKVGQEQQAYE